MPYVHSKDTPGYTPWHMGWDGEWAYSEIELWHKHTHYTLTVVTYRARRHEIQYLTPKSQELHGAIPMASSF